jgi:hypothetical protein
MDLETWIDVGVISTGRRLFVLELMKAAALEIGGNEELVARIDEAMAHEMQTRDLEGLWGGVRAGNVDARSVKPIDRRVDKVITAVRDGAEAQRKGAADDDPIHETVDTFLKTAMPEGVVAITSLPHVEQLSATQKLLAMLKGPLASTVTELGLGRQVGRLDEILPAYHAAIHGSGELGVSFTPVRESRKRGQRYLCEIVAIIVGQYNRDEDPAHQAARARLLTPLWNQLEAARALRARRNGRDTEPGEPDEPALPGDTLSGVTPSSEQPDEQSVV